MTDCKLKRGKVHARKEKSVRGRKAYKGEGKQEAKRQKENEGGKCKRKKRHVREGRWKREGGPG